MQTSFAFATINVFTDDGDGDERLQQGKMRWLVPDNTLFRPFCSSSLYAEVSTAMMARSGTQAWLDNVWYKWCAAVFWSVLRSNMMLLDVLARVKVNLVAANQVPLAANQNQIKKSTVRFAGAISANYF